MRPDLQIIATCSSAFEILQKGNKPQQAKKRSSNSIQLIFQK
jgi:hypothetical protein